MKNLQIESVYYEIEFPFEIITINKYDELYFKFIKRLFLNYDTDYIITLKNNFITPDYIFI